MGNNRLYLLGTFQFFKGSETIKFRSENERALLAYLALESDRTHSRNSLANLLWPELPSNTAHNNMRVTLHRLRKVIGESDPAEPLLKISRDEVQLIYNDALFIDVVAFQTLVRNTELHPHLTLATCETCIANLTRATALYKGEFLEGTATANSQLLSDWVMQWQEHLHQQVLRSLHLLSTYHQRRGELNLAGQYARRQLAMEPWREEAHIQMMKILALQGERSAALNQYELCRQSLKEELGVEPCEEIRALYQHILASSDRRNNLPQHESPLIGRRSELAQVSEMLADQSCRLLTILGPGGIGKSRLALKIAESQAFVFLHGVFLVPLAGIDSTHEMISSIARALDFQLRSERNPKDQLVDFLRQKEMLIVLDNFEPLMQPGNLSAVTLLEDLLRNSFGLCMIVTSRQRLNLSYEQVLILHGLAYPDKNDMQNAGEYESVQLFLYYARRIDPEFQCAPVDQPALFEICWLLQGTPLAIALAAAWVRVMTLDAIAREIKRGLDFMTSTHVDLPERHRSLRATFDHSYSLLNPEEKETLRRLSIFPSTFTWAAAEFISGASMMILTSLTDRSLLSRVPKKEGQPDQRFQLHDLIRQYIEEKHHTQVDEHHLTKSLFVSYYLNFLIERSKHVMGGKDQKKAIEEFGDEIENIRLAISEAIEQGAHETLGQSLNILLFWYEIQGLFAEAVFIFDRIGSSLAEGLLNQSMNKVALSRYLARALIYQAVYRIELGDFDTALELAEKGLALSRQFEDREGCGMALEAIGIVAFRRGILTEARDYYEKAIEWLSDTGSEWSLASAVGNLGLVVLREGDFAQAAERIYQSLDLYIKLEDDWGKANCLGALGEWALMKGNLVLAEQRFNQVLEIRQKLGQRWFSALSLRSLGEVAYRRGSYSEAKKKFQESIAILRDYGERTRLAVTLVMYGEVCLALGENAQSSEAFYESLKIAYALGVQRTIIRALLGITDVMIHEGMDELAINILMVLFAQPLLVQEDRGKAELLFNIVQQNQAWKADYTLYANNNQESLSDLVNKLLKFAEIQERLA